MKVKQLWDLASIAQGWLLHSQHQDPNQLRRAVLTALETNSKILIEN